MKYFLGVDVGGTKTHALVADEKGQALGFGKAGPGNHETVGYPGLQAALQTSVAEALAAAELQVSAINGAGFGVGGYDWPSELPDTLAAIQPLGLTCPLEVVNDAVIGLLAGVSQGWGVAVVAGTSNNCRGRDRLGREGRVTGNGIWFGEYGGAGELVMKAVQAINYEWIQRGPATALTGTFLGLTSARDAAELLEGLVLERYQPEARWVTAIFQTALEGDPIAREVIGWAGCELGELACAVIRQLNLERERVEIVLVGSLYDGGELLLESMRTTILKVAPAACLIRPTAPPVLGGILLGMEQVGLDGYLVRDELVESTRRLLGEGVLG